ncbi:MAG: ShlB/FhaC/HecB family hemolysin secretion/activation protein [Azonexus sp.]|nr:ShlB/FhaC/HecB family hemolysin secretion/activation protein [Azonexus sp.]
MKKKQALSNTNSILVALACAVWAVCSPAQVYAQSAADRDAAARQAEIIQRQNELQRQRDLERNLPPERKADGIDTSALQPKVDASKAGAVCHNISEIRITSAPGLSDEARAKVNREFTHRCLGVSEIEQILGLITQDYIQRGYITTRAYLPQQDLGKGVLEILVIEGKIGRLQLKDLENGGSIRLGNAFPSGAGDVLNLRDLEQGIEQLNRLASNNATMDIQPGDKPGESVVIVANKASRPVHGGVSADTEGSKNTGRNEWGAFFSVDSAFGFNEFLMVSHRESLPVEKPNTASRMNSVVLIVPFGYSSLTVSHTDSSYVSNIKTPGGLNLASSGESRTDSIRIDRKVFRDQSSGLLLSATLSVKTSNNYLEDLHLDVASRTLSILDVGASYTTVFWGGPLTLDVGYARGLRLAGALKDMDNLPGYAAHAQFDKYSVGYNYRKPFAVGSEQFSFSSALTAQWAAQTLYGSEQMLIGGIYTVRGFVDQTLSGDHGYYVRNELSWHRPIAIGGQWLTTRFYLALDEGGVKNRAPNIPNGHLMGGAVGASFSILGGSVDTFYSFPISHPGFMKKEDPQAWVRLSYSL